MNVDISAKALEPLINEIRQKVSQEAQQGYIKKHLEFNALVEEMIQKLNDMKYVGPEYEYQKCSMCQKDKNVSDFYPRRNRQNAYESRCKPCALKYKRDIKQKANEDTGITPQRISKYNSNCRECKTPIATGLIFCSESCESIYIQNKKYEKAKKSKGIKSFIAPEAPRCPDCNLIVSSHDTKCAKCITKTTKPDGHESITCVMCGIPKEVSRYYPRDIKEKVCQQCNNKQIADWKRQNGIGGIPLMTALPDDFDWNHPVALKRMGGQCLNCQKTVVEGVGYCNVKCKNIFLGSASDGEIENVLIGSVSKPQTRTKRGGNYKDILQSAKKRYPKTYNNKYLYQPQP